MRISSLVVISVLAASSLCFGKASNFLVKDGFIVSCNSTDSVGQRIFKMKLTNSSATQLAFTLDTFICAQENDVISLKPLALSTPAPFKTLYREMTYEVKQAVLLVTNNENTQEILRMNIDGEQSSQTIVIEKNLLTEQSVDMTLVGLGVTKMNGQIIDQGSIFGGHYRFINLQ